MCSLNVIVMFALTNPLLRHRLEPMINLEKLAASTADELIKKFGPTLRKSLTDGLMAEMSRGLSSSQTGPTKTGTKSVKKRGAKKTNGEPRQKRTTHGEVVDVTAKMMEIIASWNANTRVAISELETVTNIDRSTLHRALKKLLQDEVIVRVGNKRTSRYALPGATDVAPPTEDEVRQAV